MTDNEYIIKVPKTPPKEQLEHLQDYHILVEEETLPYGDAYLVHYEVFWDAEDELFYLLEQNGVPSWETGIPYEDVKGCLSMNDTVYELEEESDDNNESKETTCSQD